MTPTIPTADLGSARPATPAGDGPPYPPGHPLSPDPAPAHWRVPLTPEQTDRWAGKYVAWAWDGSAIVAGADSREELDDQLTRLGLHYSRVVYGYIDRPDEGNW